MLELSHVHYFSHVRPNGKTQLTRSDLHPALWEAQLPAGVTRFSAGAVVSSDHDACLNNLSWLSIPLQTDLHFLLQEYLCSPYPLTTSLYVLARLLPKFTVLSLTSGPSLLPQTHFFLNAQPLPHILCHDLHITISRIQSKIFPLSWVEVPHPTTKIDMLEFYPTVPKNMTLLDDNIFTEVIMCNGPLAWALIQYD